jgi:hypothetical protein
MPNECGGSIQCFAQIANTRKIVTTSFTKSHIHIIHSNEHPLQVQHRKPHYLSPPS